MQEQLNFTPPTPESDLSDATTEYLIHLKDAHLEALNKAELAIHRINQELERREGVLEALREEVKHDEMR